MVMGAQRARTLSPAPSASAAASPDTASPAAASSAAASPDTASSAASSAVAGPTQACADRLDQLGPALAARGMAASLVTPAGRVPSLRVVNPAAPALAEDVYAGCCEDGSWWFWWSWAERIAAATDLDQAAARIAHVLAASPGG
jgi:hypothetical protein